MAKRTAQMGAGSLTACACKSANTHTPGLETHPACKSANTHTPGLETHPACKSANTHRPHAIDLSTSFPSLLHPMLHIKKVLYSPPGGV
jgi:hypothetical protein